ncbi:MAG TPA: hypothetical protein VEU09_06285 [Candidatus Binatia bacterium]|nr:hypothetical protein [Candidatus Binatia bacterium]
MYAGHLGLGLALKAKEPRAQTWALLLGVGFLDVLFGPFVLLGIERAHLTPGISPGFSLDYIDWSHSLLMSLVWATLYGLLFVKQGRAVALILGFSVFSHFLLDLPMHPGDLALWPGSAAHLGFGLWRVWPRGWWWVELAVVVISCSYYWWRARRVRTFGGRAGWAFATVVTLHLLNSPWLSPSKR